MYFTGFHRDDPVREYMEDIVLVVSLGVFTVVWLVTAIYEASKA
jgi:hypothetical protein